MLALGILSTADQGSPQFFSRTVFKSVYLLRYRWVLTSNDHMGLIHVLERYFVYFSEALRVMSMTLIKHVQPQLHQVVDLGALEFSVHY